MKRLRLLISGRVQGVGYRMSCASEGVKLGLLGWVRNLADGRVEALAAGPDADLERFVAWCRRGPMFAKVDDVQVTDGAGDEPLTRFEVRR